MPLLFAGRRPLALAALAFFAASGCSDTPEERRGAIHQLRAVPSADNVRKIRSMLNDPDRDVRATALQALATLVVPDAAALARRALIDRDAFVRATAAKLLGDLGAVESAATLAPLLGRDPDPVVRQRVVESLGRLGGPEALGALSLALLDPVERVRLAAIDGLVELDPAFGREGLVEILREDTVWEVRVRAAQALARTSDPGLVPDLEAALADPNEFVRAAASAALAKLGRVRPAASGVY